MKTKSTVLKSVAVLGAVTAAGTMATTTAHADAVSDAASANASAVSTTNADQQLANLKSQQAAKETQAANSNASAMSAATSAADQQIAGINSQIASRQASDAAANSAAVASQTTAINSAAATSAENASYSAAVKSATANEQVNEQSAKKNVVSPAQQQAQLSSASASYQDAVNAASAANAISLAKAKSGYDTQAKSVNGQINKIKESQKGTLSKAAAQVDAKIKAAADAEKAANATVATDQSNINADQTAIKNAKNQLQNAKDKLAATHTTNTAQGIKLNQQFITSLPKLPSESDTLDAASKAQQENDYELFLANPYQSNAAAAKEKIDIHKLTNDQVIEINQYALDLVNNIRKTFSPKLPMLKSNTDYALWLQKNTTIEAQDKMGVNHDHSKFVDANKYGPFGENAANQSYVAPQKTKESWSQVKPSEIFPNVNAYAGANATLQTMDDLRAMVFYWTTAMLFEHGGGHGHAQNYTSNLTGPTYTAIGVSPVSTSNAEDENNYFCDIIYRYDYTTPSYITSGTDLTSDVSDNVISLKNAIVTANSALEDANAKLTSDTAKLGQDKKVATDATNKYNDLVASRTQDIAKIAGNTDVSGQINKLQKQLTSLKTSYDNQVKQISSDYQAKLSSLKSDYDAQVSKIKAEPTSVDQAIAKIKADYQAQLAQLKKNHEAKLAEIQNDAKAKIEALKKQVSENDPEITKLQGQIKTIKDNLAKQQKALDDQFAALKAQDQEEYNALEQKLKNTSSEAAKGNNDHYNTSDGHEVVLPGNDDQATSNHATNVATISYPASQAQVSANVAPMTREAVKAQENGTKLPQTGNENGIVAMALGAMAAMLGLGFAAKKRY